MRGHGADPRSVARWPDEQVADTPLFAAWRQVRTGDPETSHEAARRNADGLALQRTEVLAALRLLGPHGGTIFEVAARGRRMGYTWDAVAAARRLSEAGDLREAFVAKDPRRPKKDLRRPNPADTATCRVWVHARFAEQAA